MRRIEYQRMIFGVLERAESTKTPDIEVESVCMAAKQQVQSSTMLLKCCKVLFICALYT